jgi:hypothetical protein
MPNRGEVVQLSREPMPAAATTPEPASITPAVDGVAVDPITPSTAADPPAASGKRGEVPHLSPERAAPPIISEPVILLATEYPGAEPDNDPTKTNLA